mmetsp:Transcript_10745/g.16311  ORF Transcript_10745/g.16311 Transcript_10745/m.16311 type:complete len:1747 (+) Transcript_10745:218-5458(+)|eukprot:CAMPEP_0185035772 /NCGR_PEP_ID=MMETSP1103-20130426/27731_1 /TAXON_ID=36769 /ORGANISM="Paraphysomonas bandaiensis, Strain Caron Lab Isolate" /LENGTH=1746 /DNA_ID=CAMNT_0027573019 /DNA_START=146 /DNA_END=5386 /DNA_ORIENTATION=+
MSSTSPATNEYELSLDDVRRYLLDTGADAEAERVLLGGSNESPTKPSVAKPTAPNASIYSNPRSMYEQLIWEKERERDELLNKLLLEENMSQENAKKEEEELARLAELDAKLRAEHLEIELAKQKLAQEVKEAKRADLEDIEADTLRELAQLDQAQREMEADMARRKEEMENLRREVKQAKEGLYAVDRERERAYEERRKDGHTSVKHREEMTKLAAEHAQRLAASRALKQSALDDQQQLQRGGYFQSKAYANKPEIKKSSYQPDVVETRDEDVGKVQSGEENVSRVQSRGTSVSRTDSLQAAENSASSRPSGSPLPNLENSRGLVDSLATEAGLKVQEERLQALKTRMQNGVSSSPIDTQPPSRVARMKEEERRKKMIQVDESGRVLSSQEFLEKWLMGDISTDAMLSPSKRSDKTSENRAEMSGGVVSEVSQSPSDISLKSISMKNAVMDTGRDTLDEAMKEVQESSSNNNNSSQHNGEPQMHWRDFHENSHNALRSRSSHKSLKGPEERQRDFRNEPRNNQRPHSNGSESNDGIHGREYVYASGFDRDIRQRRRQRGNRGIPNDHGGNMYHPGNYPSNPYMHKPNPQAPMYPSASPFGVPYNAPYGQNPFMQQPYMQPGYNPPYQQQYGQPPYQPAQPFPQYPPSNQQIQPPNHHDHPPQQQSFIKEMQQLAEQLEQENSKLSSLGNKPISRSGDGSTAAESYVDSTPNYLKHVAPQQNSPKRLSRAEIKHREEMRRMQFEIEKLKQLEALEDVKRELEMRRSAKNSEEEHQRWLEDQKRQLQALKIKQALAMEESRLQESCGNNKKLPSPTSARKEKTTAQTPAKESLDSVSTNYIDGLSFVLDGVVVSSDVITDGSFRVTCSLYSYKNKPLGRMQSSNWVPWSKPVGSANRTGTVQYASSSVTRKPPKSSKHNAKTCANRSEEDLGQDPTNFVKVLMEVQSMEDENSVSKPVGWALCSMPLVTPNGPIPGASEDELRISPGAWRIKVRKGIASTSGRQRSSTTDASDGWFLFRVLPDNIDISDPLSISGKTQNLNDVAAVFDKYEPLEGGGAEVSVLPQKTLSKLPSLMKMKSHVSSSPAPSKSGTARTIKTANSRASFNRLASMKSLESQKSMAPSQSKTTLSTDDDARTALKEEDEKSDSDAGSTHSSQHSIPDEETNDPVSKFWTLGSPCGPCTEKYQKGDGIDIYVDGAMYLPDNCTISRCVVKIMTPDYEAVGEPHEGLSALSEGTAVSPIYKIKVECRQQVMNTASTVLLRIDTMCSNTLESVGVGYAAIKLFSTRDREQPTSANANDVYINTGLFQLPIYGGRLKKAKLMDEKCLVNAKMPKIPCATLLVRIYSAPKSSDGVDVLSKADYPAADWARLKLDIPPPGAYLTGCYDGRLCEPTPTIVQAFEAKAAQMNRTVETMCTQAIGAVSQAKLPTHIPPKPVNPSPDELQEWYSRILCPSTNVRMVLNYALTTPYSFDSGVSLSINELHNLPESGMFGTNDVLYKVIYSTSPPGLFYKEPPLAEGVHFTRDVNVESCLKHPAYNDGFCTFHPTSIEKKLCFIFDVRSINLEYSKTKSDYDIQVQPTVKRKSFWTIFPFGTEIIKKVGYTHVVSGVYQLPLIEGPVNQSVIESDHPFEELIRVLSMKKSPLKLCESGASILVRVLNPLLENILSDTMQHWKDHINTQYMKELIKAAQTSGAGPKTDVFVYDMSKFLGAKTIDKHFKKTSDIKKLMKNVNLQFAQHTQITHDAI